MFSDLPDDFDEVEETLGEIVDGCRWSQRHTDATTLTEAKTPVNHHPVHQVETIARSPHRKCIVCDTSKPLVINRCSVQCWHVALCVDCDRARFEVLSKLIRDELRSSLQRNGKKPSASQYLLVHKKKLEMYVWCPLCRVVSKPNLIEQTVKFHLHYL